MSVPGDNGTGEAPAGEPVKYYLVINNTGDTASNYSFSCITDSSNFTCAFNTTNNSISVGQYNILNVTVNVTVLYSAFEGEISKTNVTVTDSLGISKLLGSLFYTTTAKGSLGNVTVTNVSQYVHFAGEIYNFTIMINNTGNVNLETLYNITVTAQNSSGWTLSVSNHSITTTVNDTITANFTLDITALSKGNLSVQVTVPSGATAVNFTTLFVKAVSATNDSRFSENATILIKIPYFNFTVNMKLDNSTDRMNFTIASIVREPNVNLNISTLSSLNYTIANSSGVIASNASANLNDFYTYSISNYTNWSAGAYNLTIKGNTTVAAGNYSFTLSGIFYIARSINLTVAGPSSQVTSGQYFNITAWSWLGNTSISTNASSSDDRPTISSFLGGWCSYYDTSSSNYTFQCYATPTANTTYYVVVASILNNCSRDFNCIFSPALAKNYSIGVQEITNVASSSQQQQQGAGANITINQTSTTSTGIKITMLSGINLQNSQVFTIFLNNTNTSRQNLSVVIGESGDYLHFSLTYAAPKNISGTSTAYVNVTLTPLKWAKPGMYTVAVTINAASSTFTVTVPQPNLTKNIYRYVEVSKNRTTSMVTLIVKNRNSYSEFVNVTENISKQIAASAKNLTITSTINYTVIEQDPVIMWTMNLSSNQEKSIIYLVGGDMGNSNLFIEPNISEGRISTGSSGGGGTIAGVSDMTWLIIGIIVVIVIAAAVVVYLFFLKPRGIKLPINYAAFVKQKEKGTGVLGVLKGIPAKIMSVFKRGKKEATLKEAPAGEKKGLFSRLSFKKKPTLMEEPKKEEKTIEPGKPKPTKEDLLKKLNEVYKK